MNYDTLIFDLDGTLTDPKLGITRCVQYALARLGIDEPDTERLIPYIGPPLAYGFRTFHGIPEDRIPEAIAAYRERFSVTGMYENEPYPGVEEMLVRMKSRGLRVVLATSKLETYAVKILAHFQMLSSFDYVAGSLLDGSRSEKGEVIRHAMHQLSLSPAQTLMIGDTKFDMIGAKENGLDSIAVSYGYGNWEETLAAGPTYTCDSVVALNEALVRAQGSIG